jgi:hypothetical protein
MSHTTSNLKEISSLETLKPLWKQALSEYNADRERLGITYKLLGNRSLLEKLSAAEREIMEVHLSVLDSISKRSCEIAGFYPN